MTFTALFDAQADAMAHDLAVVEAARAAEHDTSHRLPAHPGLIPPGVIPYHLQGRPGLRKVNVLDTVTAAPCPNCGTQGWIIDGHERDTWLLCLDLRDVGCVETKAVPKWFDVDPEPAVD